MQNVWFCAPRYDCTKLQYGNKTSTASASRFQEAVGVYSSSLVITCGTGPAGTEIRL